MSDDLQEFHFFKNSPVNLRTHQVQLNKLNWIFNSPKKNCFDFCNFVPSGNACMIHAIAFRYVVGVNDVSTHYRTTLAVDKRTRYSVGPEYVENEFIHDQAKLYSYTYDPGTSEPVQRSLFAGDEADTSLAGTVLTVDNSVTDLFDVIYDKTGIVCLAGPCVNNHYWFHKFKTPIRFLSRIDGMFPGPKVTNSIVCYPTSTISDEGTGPEAAYVTGHMSWTIYYTDI